MTSTFHGLETARRGMTTQQYALHTTGNNISNANTPGYTRQRVNFQPTEAYPAAARNAPSMPGQIGTGVKAGSVQRVREQFLDVQYRNENNKTGYWESRTVALEKMEDILDEPSTSGLSSQIDRFWTSLQDLSVDPEDAGARSVVRQRGLAVAETFNYLHDSLSTIRTDYKNEIDVTVTGLNSMIDQLNNVNKQIRETEPHGYVTNDLYDQQDKLLDQISSIIDIQVQREKSPGMPNAAAEGAVTLSMRAPDGSMITLVNGTDAEAVRKIEVEYNASGDAVQQLHVKDKDGADLDPPAEMGFSSFSRGELKGMVEAFGYHVDPADATSAVKGTYPDMLASINEMAFQFATEINNIHKIGFTLPNLTGVTNLGSDFFKDNFDMTNAAKNLKLDDAILANLDNITAAGVNKDALTAQARSDYETLMANSNKTQADYDNIRSLLADPASFNGKAKAFSGDGSNAKRLADVKDTLLNFGGASSTVTSFYQGVIGQMAVDTQEAARMMDSSDALRYSVDTRRQSVSNVSLDEEMTMMIQFQHAYNAAARNITMVDEMLDKIINGMGLVGR
ncbi:flagellar hook-associated protein FlgK [Bacillus solitudinis]|uniref:flagellar hook-associated protein FlgK n=1 Tax=Bacillus solitudinis TaxID=2014074 RepID=UPI000C242AD2|nr:flagellar hook-associated protein FlgK [Bacillus solitudinis]